MYRIFFCVLFFLWSKLCQAKLEVYSYWWVCSKDFSLADSFRDVWVCVCAMTHNRNFHTLVVFDWRGGVAWQSSFKKVDSTGSHQWCLSDFCAKAVVDVSQNYAHLRWTWMEGKQSNLLSFHTLEWEGMLKVQGKC